MSFLTWIVLGLIAGFIASKIVNKQGEGFFLDIILGIVGAVAGGCIFSAFGAGGAAACLPHPKVSRNAAPSNTTHRILFKFFIPENSNVWLTDAPQHLRGAGLLLSPVRTSTETTTQSAN